MRTHLPISYGNELAKCFYLANAPSLLMRPRSHAQLAATRVTVAGGLREPTASVRTERAFTVSVHLVEPASQHWGTWVAGRFVPVKSWVAGGIGIYDLESDPRALRDTAFDALHYNLPRTTLDAFTEDSGLRRVDALSCEQGTRDPMLYHLACMLLPFLERRTQPSNLFCEHFALLFCGHLVQTYSSSGATRATARRGLASWQLRRTREVLDTQLASDVSLTTLARECGLSVSHFARSFKQSFGTSVHRYVILQRVEEAKTLLMHSSRPLSTIAIDTGFSDQAAFSRTFRAVVGTSPGKWRTQYGRRKF